MFCIQGPPGTGKTTTLVEIILQLLARSACGAKILVVAPTNVAVDNILERLSDWDQYLPHNKVIRNANITKLEQIQLEFPKNKKYFWSEVLLRDPDMEHSRWEWEQANNAYNNSYNANSYKTYAEHSRKIVEAEKNARNNLTSAANVVFSTADSSGYSQYGIAKFDYVLVDEAAQCHLPSLLLPLSCAEKCVLIGDPQQLPPVIKNRENDNFKKSLMEMIYENPGAGSICAMLTEQYRMNKQIMAWPNKEIYDGKLTAHYSNATRRMRSLQPIIFVDSSECQWQETRSDNAFSVGNLYEAEIILKHSFELVMIHGIEPKDIGVITPYNFQAEIVKKKLKTKKATENIHVSTVDSFQGQARKVILVSLVRSNLHEEQKLSVGFLKDIRRMNVTVSRAEEHLFIVGDVKTLSQCSELKGFLEFMTDPQNADQRLGINYETQNSENFVDLRKNLSPNIPETFKLSLFSVLFEEDTKESFVFKYNEFSDEHKNDIRKVTDKYSHVIKTVIRWDKPGTSQYMKMTRYGKALNSGQSQANTNVSSIATQSDTSSSSLDEFPPSHYSDSELPQDDVSEEGVL